MKRSRSSPFTVEQLEARQLLTAYTDFTGNPQTPLATFPVGTQPLGVPVLAGGTIFFVAQSAAQGQELWVSDGTQAGTRLVCDINPGAAGSAPSEMLAYNNQVYFRADDGVHGQELWRSDGTVDGTRMVADLDPGTASSAATPAIVVRNKLLFTATIDYANYLFRLDGPTGSPIVVQAFDADTPADFFKFGGRTFFFTASSSGSSLWQTDGTPEETAWIATLPGMRPAGVYGRQPTQLGDQVLFRLSAGGIGSQRICATDGTASGTRTVVLISNFNSLPSRTRHDFTVHNGRLYFIGYSPETGQELWSTDGTSAGTGLVKDTVPGPADGNIILPGGVVHQPRLIFAAESLSEGKIWVSDGTSAGSSRLTGYTARTFAEFGGVMFFCGNAVLGRTDGTLQNTARFYVTGGVGMSYFTALGPAWNGQMLYFGERTMWALSPTDTQPPTVLGWGSYSHPANVSFGVSEDIGNTLSSTDLIVENLTTGEVLDPALYAAVSDDYWNTGCEVWFDNYPLEYPPDGNYRITLKAGSIGDSYGNVLVNEYSHTFYSLLGDINHDRAVDLLDYHQISIRFGYRLDIADYNHSGLIDLFDFTTFASQFGKRVPPLEASAATVAATSPTTLETSPFNAGVIIRIEELGEAPTDSVEPN